MRIEPICYTNIINTNKNEAKPAFTAHPDFYKYNSVQSCFFRRGAVLLSCAKGYADIESLFCKIFKTNENLPKKMLIVGVGNSQEPFSYLASIKGIMEDSLLKNNIDLHTVDLQSKPKHLELKKCSFCDLYDYQSFPKYAGRSFVKDNYNNWLERKPQKTELAPIGQLLIYNQKSYIPKESLHWRVNDEVFNCLETTYNNPKKSMWESRIQDIIKDYPDNQFDIISANNVIPYITAFSLSEMSHTIKNMMRILKPNGYIITDPYKNEYHTIEIANSNKMKEIFSGIYQKIND